MNISNFCNALQAAWTGCLQRSPEPGRVIRLSEGGTPPGVVRFLSQKLELTEGAKTTWVTLTRTGEFSDPRYGKFQITGTMLDEMVRNFDQRTLGQDVFIDVSHRPSDGAAGKLLKLQVEDGRLRGLVEWTPFGASAIRERGFTYLSAEYHEQFTDNERGAAHGCVLLGAGLTTRPVIKNLDPVQLSVPDDDSSARVLISHQLLRELSMDEYIKLLSAALITLGFTEINIQPLVAEARKQLEAVKDDKTKCLAVVEAFKTAGAAALAQTKAAGGDPKLVTIQLAAPAATVDVAAEVRKVLDQANLAAAQKKATLDAKLKLLSDTIALEKSLTPEGVTKLAADVALLVTDASSDDQVRALAELQVRNWNGLSAATKLAGLGYQPPSGQVHVVVAHGNSIKSLQAEIDKRLGYVRDDDAARFYRTGGRLLPANKEFAERALAHFDAEHGADLDREHKALSAGTGNVSDVRVPVIAERTVLREALYNLTSLNFVNTGTAPFANVISYRAAVDQLKAERSTLFVDYLRSLGDELGAVAEETRLATQGFDAVQLGLYSMNEDHSSYSSVHLKHGRYLRVWIDVTASVLAQPAAPAVGAPAAATTAA